MNVLKPHKQTTIFTLLGLGKSQRDIERITGIDRKTIRSYQRLLRPVVQIPPGWPPTPLSKFPHPGHRLCRFRQRR